jgi:hypothetical protein
MWIRVLRHRIRLSEIRKEIFGEEFSEESNEGRRRGCGRRSKRRL